MDDIRQSIRNLLNLAGEFIAEAMTGPPRFARFYLRLATLCVLIAMMTSCVAASLYEHAEDHAVATQVIAEDCAEHGEVIDADLVDGDLPHKCTKQELAKEARRARCIMYGLQHRDCDGDR